MQRRDAPRTQPGRDRARPKPHRDRSQPGRKPSRTVRVALSAFGSSRQIDCHVPSPIRPPTTGTVSDGGASSGSTWSAPCPASRGGGGRSGRAGQQAIEGDHQVALRARADLDDDEPGRGVRHEDRQEAVTIVGGVGDERRTAPR